MAEEDQWLSIQPTNFSMQRYIEKTKLQKKRETKYNITSNANWCSLAVRPRSIFLHLNENFMTFYFVICKKMINFGYN